MSNLYGIKPYGATPTYRQISHLELGKKAFFHFGVNTFTNKEWGDGTEVEKLFNPTDLDIRSWIRQIKAAGYKLAIITAKHHDGFCLWPSAYTEHSVKNSPYKNGKGDIIREFTDACHEYNVKVGIYVSPWDRNSPCWGKPDYSTYYANQLEEILTQYGRIDEIWWDGAGSVEAKYDWGLWAYLVRKHQPDAVIFGSMGATPYAEMRWVGTEAGYAGKTHYASINREMMFVERIEDMNRGVIGGEIYVPAEVDVSIRPGWFYHPEQDEMVKSDRAIDEIWFRSVGNNAIMLLNFPPDRQGLLHPTDVKNAIISNRRIEKMLSVNYIDNAVLSADSTYSPDTEIYSAANTDSDLFYASAADNDRAVINIDLGDTASEINTLIIGEKVELGERIHSFTLESLDSEQPEILYTGTSVGYLRAVRFASGFYKKLRLTLKGITAPVTLRTLGVYYYEESKEEVAEKANKINLASLPSCDSIIDSDGKRATILFGGIYPFDTISFVSSYPTSSFKIYAFDGSKYYLVHEGHSLNYKIKVKLDEPVTSSYQVRIEIDCGFSIEPEIEIY